MNVNLNKRALLGLLATIVMIASGCAVAPLTAAPVVVDGYEEAATEIITVEVSEDMNRFIFDQDVVYEDGMPAHGSGFVTVGYVYPAGTLNGSNGVNADGSPEFPDQVIGEWICKGYMINDAAHATGGAWVVSTQIINLSSELGGDTIITEGYEFADDTIVSRAITGGSGQYVGARGQAEQAFIGLNATEGVVLTMDLHVQK